MIVTDNLSAFFVTMYQKDKSCLSFLIESAVPKYIMLRTYNLFVRYGEITKIEELETEHKMELIEKCKSTGIDFSNATLIHAAKIVHTLNEINANS